MASISFLGDLLQAIGDRGRDLVGLGRGDTGPTTAAELLQSCEDLLSRRGEASGVALARLILERYAAMPESERLSFLGLIAADFDADHRAVDAAISAYRAEPTRLRLGALHEAAEPRAQELIRRLNLAPGGTLALVRMREDLSALLESLARQEAGQEAGSDTIDSAVSLDGDFEHLFASWFNRGFLVLRPIDWNTPAGILEKIIRYEAVHEIADWDDLRRRVAPQDRRCYAFFHPALADEPLIFVEVALTAGIAPAIGPILAREREILPVESATTAVFYSISNCQPGLAGVTFGNFLIKQVVADLAREIPTLETFVTLSPVPGFRAWLDRERRTEAPRALSREEVEALRHLDIPDWTSDAARRDAVRQAMIPAAAGYFLRAKNGRERPLDPVARFHLGNGARLERMNFLGDLTPAGMDRSYGLMANYLYDLSAIEKNHEAYAALGTVAASAAVSRALRAAPAPRDAEPAGD